MTCVTSRLLFLQSANTNSSVTGRVSRERDEYLSSNFEKHHVDPLRASESVKKPRMPHQGLTLFHVPNGGFIMTVSIRRSRVVGSNIAIDSSTVAARESPVSRLGSCACTSVISSSISTDAMFSRAMFNASSSISTARTDLPARIQRWKKKRTSAGKRRERRDLLRSHHDCSNRKNSASATEIDH